MKNIVRAAALGLLTAPLLLASCKKEGDDNTLEGPVPVADFSSTVDASQFPVRVSFKNNSQDGFIYQWDFGDNSGLGKGTDVVHPYQRAGTYQVKLTAAGRGGTSPTQQKSVVIPSACDNAGFSFLTACSGTGAASWTISNQPGAIITYAANGTTVVSSLPATGTQLPACLLDDQFSFGSNYAYGYDAGGVTGQTYSTATNTCGTARAASSSFIYKPVAGTLGQIILTTNKSFIGLSDSVVNKTYDILEATATRLRLSGTNPNGTKTVVTYTPQLSAVDQAKQFLTGGSTRTWKLDNTMAATIVVGPSDADPTGYYAGGLAGSLPPCQADDEFTFTMANTYQYNALAETFVAGSSGGCQAPRNVTTSFTFGAATGAGIAQFELAPATPSPFIGITDAPDRVYRIISIDNQHMVLRAGSSTAGTIFTMKLVVK
ncbi:PKD domain-containing protein [Hymenobacter negativus]|uniref:PKD domain-containing protein n=1 Tax=Hymenobacter negativus TaxID=2795026 RepID=A0ABS3QHG2_9BACT|nr:PKD domain-containing protein [Hymenobacter negativus]MBO2010597.1 PKD domain-containing protein [Hymenobacter negativus]